VYAAVAVATLGLADACAFVFQGRLKPALFLFVISIAAIAFAFLEAALPSKRAGAFQALLAGSFIFALCIIDLTQRPPLVIAIALIGGVIAGLFGILIGATRIVKHEP
jgi:hypothetical protein